jgi:hypothetical protein
VGFYPYPFKYNPNQSEIEKIIEIPLIHFLGENIFEIKPYTNNNYTWMVHYYYYQNEIVWGVTGFLLSNFLSIIFGVDRNISEEIIR